MAELSSMIYRFKATPTNSNSPLCISGKDDLHIHMELHKIPNSQNNIEKEQIWRTHTSLLQNLPQSYSDQNSVVQL